MGRGGCGLHYFSDFDVTNNYTTDKSRIHAVQLGLIISFMQYVPMYSPQWGTAD